MPITLANKPRLTGIIVLFLGVALLIFTFINAFLFLKEPLGIFATGDLARVFGEALAPLIQACIRLMYLGIMGWIGSLLTVRGIPLVTYKQASVAPPTPTQPRTQAPPAKHPQPKPSAPTRTPSPQQSKPTPMSQAAIQPSTSDKEPANKEPAAVLISPESQGEE
jgi:hypothetical protein